MNKKTLDKLICNDFGITMTSHPTLFSDCFPGIANNTDFTSKTSGFSRVLGNWITSKEIDGIYNDADDILNEIWKTRKIQNTAAYKAFPKEVEAGLKTAVGFLIIRRHPEAEKYPELMELREVFNQSANVVGLASRGRHTGEHTEEIQEAVRSTLSANNNMVVNAKLLMRFNMLEKFLTDEAILRGNPLAIELYKNLDSDKTQDKDTTLPSLRSGAGLFG